MKRILSFPKKAVIFDLDGVLLNSRPNMEQAWQGVQDNLGVTVSFEDYFKNIGRPFRDILELIGLSDLADEIEPIYSQVSKEKFHLATFYPGVEETLKKLESYGIKLGIVTSKDTERTGIVLNRLQVKFTAVQTPNAHFRGKPAPDHILMAIAEINADPKESIYIGDAEVDVLAASRAGIDYCHAGWGYCEPGCDDVVVLKDISRLLTVLKID